MSTPTPVESFSQRPRKRRWILPVAAVVLLLATVEIVLGILARSQDRARHDQPGVSYTLTTLTSDGVPVVGRAGRLKLVVDPYLPYRNLPNQSDPWFTINSRGYRGEEVDLGPETIRVVLVGGSAAFGTGALSDEATVAEALERRFHGVQVVNAGIVGIASSDELMLLKQELLDLQPALVIALDGFNDYHLSTILPYGGHLTAGAFHDFQQRLITLNQLESNPLLASRAFLMSLFPQIAARLARLGRLPSRVRQELGEMPDDRLAEKLKLYTRNIEWMAEAAERRQARFLSLLQPERAGEWRFAEYYAERYARFIRGAEKFAGERDIPHLNLHEMDEINKGHFLDGDSVHFNGKGCELVADIVSRYIKENELLPSNTWRLPGSGENGP